MLIITANVSQPANIFLWNNYLRNTWVLYPRKIEHSLDLAWVKLNVDSCYWFFRSCQVPFTQCNFYITMKTLYTHGQPEHLVSLRLTCKKKLCNKLILLDELKMVLGSNHSLVGLFCCFCCCVFTCGWFNNLVIGSSPMERLGQCWAHYFSSAYSIDFPKF